VAFGFERFWRDKICGQRLSTNTLAPALRLAAEGSRSAKEKLQYTDGASGVSGKERARTSTLELVRRISLLPASNCFTSVLKGHDKGVEWMESGPPAPRMLLEQQSVAGYLA
jgi:hypothetical protein